MGKGNKAVFKLFVVILCLIFINGNKSLFLLGNTDQILIMHDLANDIEIPNQQHCVTFADDEKYPGSPVIDFFSLHLSSIQFLFTLNSFPQEFSSSVWQPPKIA
jgi:hypothetical protein